MTRIEVTDRGAVVAQGSAYSSSALSAGTTHQQQPGLPSGAPERPAPPTCLLCGGIGIEGNELGLTTLGFDFISDAFPAHNGCVKDYVYAQAIEHMMREALEW